MWLPVQKNKLQKYTSSNNTYCLLCFSRFKIEVDSLRKHALAVLKATFLQSGKMLIELGGNPYVTFRNTTNASVLLSLFIRKAAHPPDFV